ncbi:MAG: hypothetical protein ACXW3U_15525, partial [Rhodoplanes sp.]
LFVPMSAAADFGWRVNRHPCSAPSLPPPQAGEGGSHRRQACAACAGLRAAQEGAWTAEFASGGDDTEILGG